MMSPLRLDVKVRDEVGSRSKLLVVAITVLHDRRERSAFIIRMRLFWQETEKTEMKNRDRERERESERGEIERARETERQRE